ncbi:hypothetical protein BH09SUM1_BH09SUM1_21650 [soil metagenome]
MESTSPLPPPATLASEIEDWSRRISKPVTLRELYEVGRNAGANSVLQSARFLHREMPIRLAQKVKELESMPDGLVSVPSIALVRDWYLQSFWEMADFPEMQSEEDEAKFCRMISRIKSRHKTQVPVMARGIRQYLDRKGARAISPALQRFLDSFYNSRIGIRVLLGHQVALHEQRGDGWFGIICAQTSPAEVVENAAGLATDLCRRTLGEPPAVRIVQQGNLRFKYIPSHLHLMLFELLKNSFRAVVERSHHVSSTGGPLAPVQVVIAGGGEDVTIKISDEGGGIPRSSMEQVWTYAYTTVDHGPHTYTNDDDVMAGLGYGLPLCRLYARYFGGEMQLVSLEGHGTDAYVYLSRLGNMHEAIV